MATPTYQLFRFDEISCWRSAQIREIDCWKAGKPFVQSMTIKMMILNLKGRADKTLGKKLLSGDAARLACETWFDVQAFGQLFAYAAEGKEGEHFDCHPWLRQHPHSFQR
ncbi:MAG: hypothetical protein R3E93_14680 [Thiothrix sp.]